ncbi:MAG TPA: pirin family protein [Nocardioides sp.]|nr:pirin family protein [Nocardioides sp.]
MTVEIRRSTDRFVDRESGRMTRHAFSFGQHYRPDWASFGPMVCHDDHLLGAGKGFTDHPHSGLEIVTTVLSGSLEHRDSTGTARTLAAGGVAVLSAGVGVSHAELAPASGSARFVQVWLTPDDGGTEPAYAAAEVDAAEGAGLVPVVGGGGPLDIGVAGASYAVARLAAGETLALPAAPRLHVYLASGALLRSSLAEPLHDGDAFLMTGEPSYEVTAAVPTHLLVWTFDR